MREPNAEQRSVIDDFSQNILLQASAGTGKTFTVAQKVKKILELGLATPDQILCLTFTIKACDEMRSDILSYEKGAEGVVVKTIHSFCFEIVKEEARRSEGFVEPAICDDVDQEEILARLLPETLSKCALRRLCREHKIVKDIEGLYACDSVYLSAGSARGSVGNPILLARQGFFWRVETADGTRYVSPFGILQEESALPRLREVTFSCPACGKKQTQAGNFCIDCGYDFRTYITPKEFSLGKRKGYRDLISLIKHSRADRMTGDERADFQAAFARLERSNGDALRRALSYFEGVERFDRELYEALSRDAGEVLSAYQGRLRAGNRLDFDDLILEAKKCLLDPDICRRWQDRYRFIIVDEMQDTSSLEYDILRRLFAHARVMMCGDFFQTIYEWRGSKPNFVTDDFLRHFHAKVYMLSENYRSTRVLTAATFGYLKNTYPAEVGKFCPESILNSAEEEGDPIRLVTCSGASDPAESEALFIFNYLRKHPADDPSRICIMARSNRYIGKLWQLLMRLNVRLEEQDRLHFFTIGQDYRFFKTPIIKDVLAFLSLLSDSDDLLSMERIAERYIHGVGAATASALREGQRLGISLLSFLDDETFKSGDPFAPLVDALNWGNVVVYDTETTGVDLAGDEIIQIAAMRTDRSGNCTQKFMRFVLPTVPISEDAERTHGYSMEFLRENGGVDAAAALAEFAEFVKGAVLVGHNSVKFDRALVDRELAENHLPPLDIRGEYDTLALSRMLLPALENHKLETLCERLEIVNERAHDAFSDVTATARVLSALCTRFLEPQTEERRRLVSRFRRRFEPFYAQYLAMRKLLADGNLKGVVSYLAEQFHLFERYDKEWERERVNVLTLLVEEKMASFPTAAGAIRALLEDAALAGSEMDVLIKRLGKIPIITVHQAKGCEFDTVLLAGTDNFLFPIANSENIDEERRLFYVAISRAKKRLILTCFCNRSERHPRLPSEFISKIPPEFIDRYTFDGRTINHID